jgi:hypothetical protein
MKKIVISLILVLSLFTGGAHAQTAIPSVPAGITPALQSQTSGGFTPQAFENPVGLEPSNLIVCKDNPTACPTAAILRFWMNDHTKNGKIKPFNGAQLSQTDTDALTAILRQYRKSYDAAFAAYNSAVTPQSTGDDDLYTQYTTAREQAVQTAWMQINANLTPIGVLTFSSYLEGKKVGLNLSPIDSSLGAIAVRNRKELSMVASSHMMPGMAMPNQGMSSNYSYYADAESTIPNMNIEKFLYGSALDTNYWTTPVGSFEIVPSLAAAEVTGGGGYGGISAIAYFRATDTTNPQDSNQYSYIVVGGAPSSPSSGMGVTTNTQGIGSSTEYYELVHYNGGGSTLNVANSEFFVAKVVGTTRTIIWSITSVGFITAGENLGLQTYQNSDGSVTLIPSYNGQTLGLPTVVKDTSSVITGGYPGMMMNTYASNGSISQWGGTNSTLIEVTNNISGNTTCSPSCPAGATHTPFLGVISQAGVGQSGYYTAVPPQNEIDENIDLTYNVSDFFNNPNNTYISTGGHINCSVVGLFYVGNPATNGTNQVIESFQLELALTASETTGPYGHRVVTKNGTYLNYPTQPYCTTYTTPPDRIVTSFNAAWPLTPNDPNGNTTIQGIGMVVRFSRWGIISGWYNPGAWVRYIIAGGSTLQKTLDGGGWPEPFVGRQNCSCWDNGYPGPLTYPRLFTPGGPPTVTNQSGPCN